MEQLTLSNVVMSPNAGTVGDKVTFKSDNIVSGIEYNAYFIAQGDKIEEVLFDPNIPQEVKKEIKENLLLIIQKQFLKKFNINVPSIDYGTKDVVIVKIANGEIVGYQKIRSKICFNCC